MEHLNFADFERYHTPRRMFLFWQRCSFRSSKEMLLIRRSRLFADTAIITVLIRCVPFSSGRCCDAKYSLLVDFGDGLRAEPG